MKTSMIIVLMAALATLYGCQSSSPQGGSVLTGQGFKVTAPALATEIQQGEVKIITVSLKREKYFKQEVKLEITVPHGIRLTPTKVIVSANDLPDVPLQITASKEAALGEYRVLVKAIPKVGQSTSVLFNVKVVAP